MAQFSRTQNFLRHKILNTTLWLRKFSITLKFLYYFSDLKNFQHLNYSYCFSNLENHGCVSKNFVKFFSFYSWMTAYFLSAYETCIQFLEILYFFSAINFLTWGKHVYTGCFSDGLTILHGVPRWSGLLWGFLWQNEWKCLKFWLACTISLVTTHSQRLRSMTGGLHFVKVKNELKTSCTSGIPNKSNGRQPSPSSCADCGQLTH